MKHLILISCLFLVACESDVDFVLRKQKECKQIGGMPITSEMDHLTTRGAMYSSWQVKCKFKEMQ